MARGNDEEIHRNGLSISAAKADYAYLAAFIAAEILKLRQACKVNGSFETEHEIYQAAEDIIAEFPSLKIEQMLEVFSRIRRGRIELFGRLDTPTLCKALRDYDVNVVCEIRERSHQIEKAEGAAGGRSLREIIESLPEERPTFAEIMARRPKLTAEQRAELAARDKARCQEQSVPD